LTQRGLR